MLEVQRRGPLADHWPGRPRALRVRLAVTVMSRLLSVTGGQLAALAESALLTLTRLEPPETRVNGEAMLEYERTM